MATRYAYSIYDHKNQILICSTHFSMYHPSNNISLKHV